MAKEEKENGELVKTGVFGLDDLFYGGIPRGSVTVVGGAPGTGKTNVALQFIYEGARKFGETGVYITIEESAKDIRANGMKFGWDIEKLEKQGLVKIVELPIYESGTNVIAQIPQIIKDAGAKRVALDSLTLLNYLYRDESARRTGLLMFIKAVKINNCTALVTAETKRDFPKLEYTPEFSLADGAIILFWSRRGQVVERAIWVMKMRGRRIMTKVAMLDITDTGVVVYPDRMLYTLETEQGKVRR